MAFQSGTVSVGDATKKSDFDQLLGNTKINQTSTVKIIGDESIAGQKSFSGRIDADGGLQLEKRTSDPGAPLTGTIWFRTDI